MEFFSIVRNPVKFRLFMLRKLPAAYLSGLRLRSVTEEACTVSVPYKWFTQNPFRSTYFACLSMAGEMSTGILSMAQLYRRKPAVSMLVTAVEGSFFKKATGLSSFTCSDGLLIREAVEKAISTGQAQSITALSRGVNEAGEHVADFRITWSFKVKSQK